VPVHPIGIGTWDMGGSRHADGTVYADYRYDSREIEAIRYSLSLGQNHIDTAQLYGAGHTEEIVGSAISYVPRDSIFLASKIWNSHLLRESVVHQVEDMLVRLKTNYLDLLYVHAPWNIVPMEEYIGGMNDALDRGLVRHLGVSNFNLPQLQSAMDLSNAPIVANQVLYNIVNRGIVSQELLDFCLSNEITIVAYRPVERKILAENAVNPDVLRIAQKYNRQAAQIAINWLVDRDGIVTIPKSSTQNHIDENLRSLEFELSKEDRLVLDSIASSSVESVI
ncbi:MAG: aldo/keto reductase, partial [Spirochaetales bacterium]|nr:aldo/keto reductase [Spirochaetales bacterium]